MHFIDVIGVLLRRWRILVIGAIITVAAAAGAIFVVPTNYQATGQVILLLPAQASGAATPTNPYLNLDPGLTIAASLISSTLSTKETQEAMKASGFTGKYALALTPGEGPLINISVQSTSPDQALRTRDEVIRRLHEQLIDIQDGEQVPNRQFIHARENSVVERAEVLPGSKIRALAAIGAVGILTTLLIAFTRDRRRLGPPRTGAADLTDSISARPPSDENHVRAADSSSARGTSPGNTALHDLDTPSRTESDGADEQADDRELVGTGRSSSGADSHTNR